MVKVKGNDIPHRLNRYSPSNQVCIYVNFIQETGKDDYHVAVVNCDQHHAFCNTLGVIPFAAGHVNESK